MRVAFGWRNALATLTDAELADRLQSACARYDAADIRRQATAIFWTSKRAGRYPRVYRFWTTLTGSPGFRVIEWSVKAMIVRTWQKGDLIDRARVMVTEEAIAMDQEIDEIARITTEIERRVMERRTITGGD
jgi:hypothetical protein